MTLQLTTQQHAAELAQRTAEADTLRKEVATRSAEALRSEGELEARLVEVALSAEHNRTAELAQLEVGLAAAVESGSAEAIRVNDELSAMHGRGKELARTVEARSAEAAHLGKKLTMARIRAARIEAESEARRIELDAIRLSNSWRVTAPLRWVRQIFTLATRLIQWSLQVFWWALTFQLGSRVLQRRSDVKLIQSSNLFDRDWYIKHYPDVKAEGIDPAGHYHQYGATEGRNPSPLFDSGWYLREYTDVRQAGINPLVHYLRYGAAEGRIPTLPNPADQSDVKLIQSSHLFDRDWYVKHYPDAKAAGIDPARHYLHYGATEGRNPSPLFDSGWYLREYTDVRQAGINPLVHYLRYGAAEGRIPTLRNPAEQSDVKLIQSSHLFDRDWYVKHYPDVKAAGIDPARHYLHYGATQGRNPSPLFDSGLYLQHYTDVRQAGINPLVHYLRYGAPEGRVPNPFFRVWHPTDHLCVYPRRPQRRWTPPKRAEPGVNLIGPVEFLNGLSKSARGYASSLMHAGIRLNVVSWRRGFEHLRRNSVEFPRVELQPINLIHLNLDLLTMWQLLDTAPLAHIVTPDRYNIAIVYWELSSIPPEWVEVIHRFDEIWCATSFMGRSIGAVSARPVRVVRPSVEGRPAQRKLTRGDFDLPEDRFVFCYVADAGGVLGRKNPGALIDAYLEEFALDEGACCLVKIHYPDPSSLDVCKLRSTIARRPDLLFMDRSLDDDEMNALYDLIDCYVSPHRSEGLGLTILEAMHGKKPVIATSYGGTTDFVNTETSLTINCRLIEVGKGNLPYPENFIWADPLRSSLRTAMRSLFRDRHLAKNLGVKGQACVRDMFSLERTALEIRSEINRIWNGDSLDPGRL